MVSKGAVVIVGLVSIVFVILIIALATRPSGRENVKLGDICSTTEECDVGLSCEMEICKSNIGSNCNTNSDCVTESAGCLNGVCVSSIANLGDTCNSTVKCATGLTCENSVCRVSTGGSCRQTSDCVMDNVCTDGVCVEDSTDDTQSSEESTDDVICLCKSRSKYGYTQYRTMIESISGRTIKDITSLGEYTITIFRDGTMTRDNGETKASIKSSLYLDRIISYGGSLLGLSDGDLYKLNNSIALHNWEWSLCDWAIGNIEHLSVTLDGTHIWLQSPYINVPDKTRGYLYEGEDLVKTYTFQSGIIRVYGRNLLTYLEIDRESSIATRYPDRKTFNGVFDGALTREGDVITVSRNVDVIVRDVGGKVQKIQS